MHKIWKYRLPPEPGTHIITMPDGANILSVQNQAGEFTLWADVLMHGEDGPPSRQRVFEVVMTGESFTYKPNARFIGTCQFRGGAFVLHVYELEREACQ